MPLTDLLLPEFDREMAGTRDVLSRVPQDKFDWRAHPTVNTVGWCARHLAEIVGWGTLTLKLSSFDVAPPGGPPFEPSQETDMAKIIAMFDRNVAAARELLAAATNESLAEPWSLLKGGETIFTTSKYGVLRKMVINHSIHHRAYLCSYLRMLDVAVPPLYGPTSDQA